MDESAKAKRRALISRLFGEGIPRLWCPPLTHYTDNGDIDFERMAAHLGHMSGSIKTYLVPGTTGDGWEMTEDQIRRVLAFDMDTAQKLNIQILVGILKTDAEAAQDFSARITSVVNDVSDGAADIPASNSFANANKAIDHFFAHGPGATDVAPPQICSGQRLPAQIITIAAQALSRNGLMPTNGYLSTESE